MRHGTKKNTQAEGLNTIKYKLIEKIKAELYTKIVVYYNQTEILPPEFVKNITNNKNKTKKKINITKKS